MPASTISRLERSGKIDATISVIAPLAGVLQELEVREGMTLAAGAPLARINGLDSVWLEVAVPEAQSAGIQVGQQAAARLPALPGQVIEGEVSAVLPEASAASRSTDLMPSMVLAICTAAKSAYHRNQLEKPRKYSPIPFSANAPR